jgi:hypothetical protein
MDAVDEEIPFQYRFAVTPEFRRAVRRALLIDFFRRPMYWIAVAAVGLVVAVSVASGSDGRALPTVIGVALFFLVVVLPGLLWISVTRQLARTLPVGALLRSGFGAAAIRTATPAGTATIPTARIASVHPVGEIIWIRYQNPRRRGLNARVLFPDDEIARLGLTVV